MGEDASLDQFIADGEAEDAATEPAAEAVDDADPDATDDIEPARTTYAWDGEGAACGECGETVERRWQQADGLVCIECKDWERA